MKNETPIKKLVLILLIAIAYFITAKLGLTVATISKSASPVWPATGLAIGVILTLGYRYWPAIFIGSFAANFFTNSPILSTFGVALGNTLEALVAVYIILNIKSVERFLRFRFDAIRLFSASLVAAALSASIGVASLYLTGALPSNIIGGVWFTWWIGDLVGAQVVTPLFSTFKSDFIDHKKWQAIPILKAVATIFIVSVFTAFVIGNNNHSSAMFLLFPAILIATYFVNSFGLSFSVFAISVVGVWIVAVEQNPFIGHGLNQNLIYVQLLLLGLSLTGNTILLFKESVPLKRPMIVLLLGWFITALSFSAIQDSEKLTDNEHFSDMITQQEFKIIENFEHYIEALRAGASLYAASTKVTAKDWKAFVERLKVIDHRPGIYGMGVIWPIKTSDTNNFVKEVRANGLPDFNIRDIPNATPPPDSQVNRYVIKYIEPYAINIKASGLDIGSEQNRREFAELARDTGRPTVTKKIFLVQGIMPEPGFLLYVPVYRNGNIPNTLEERRSQFLAWIYAPFMTRSFFSGAEIKNSNEISFFVFEGDKIVKEKLIYQSSSSSATMPEFIKTTHIIMGQSEFTIGWTKSSEFGSIHIHEHSSFWIALCGILITLLLASLVTNLVTTTRRAQRLADEQTLRLQQSEMSLKDAVEKAEAATRTKSEFLANMSHEIRTPMNAIVGMADLLSETSLTEDQIKYVNVFKNASESLLGIINDILDISKIESGYFKIEIEEFNLKSVVIDAFEMVHSRAKERKLDFRMEYSPELNEIYFGDALRIKQVIVNLLSNAVKFTLSGGIKLMVMPNDQNKKGTVLISIRDTGIGISAEKISSLFRPFTQADSSVTKRFGGTGLGLALCKQLSEMMGGEIWATSIEGVGSEFSFTLNLEPVLGISRVPLNPEEKSIDKSVLKKSTEIKGDQLRVLLVDDADDNRTLIKAYLKKSPYEIVEAENGAVALEQFKKEKFDIILMDMQMPVLDGYSATSQIRVWEKQHQLVPTPIVALTAYALKEEIEKCMNAGCDSHLSKPIKKAVLMKEISEHIVRELKSS